ncbi:shikimate 5-dehydrogenase [Sulfolobus acidocaldarius SUSAZ]|nr:shikimate 5-dehydrogenase [Sulfolobus acidocaldarius SUSAZ]
MSIEIDNYTRLFGLIGENIHYTISPAIHNYVFQRLGINAVYLSFDIKRDKFNVVMPGLLGVAQGLNVGIPYKQRMVKFLKDLSDEAKTIGAVNVIHELKGYNTDYTAFYTLVEERAPERVETCTVFGAGGAGRSSIVALGKLFGCRINILDIVDRSDTEAEFRNEGFNVKFVSSCGNSDIVVNATPNPDFVPDHCINSKLVIDWVYSPVNTSLIIRAKREGIRTVNGLEILIKQAVLGERIWFGRSIEEEEISKYLYEKKLVRVE